MAIFKRGRVYWYHFWFKDQHIQRSTRQGNPRVARQIEAAHRTRLAKGEVGIEEQKPAPTLKDFSQRFADSIQTRCAEKPRTILFYSEKLKRLLEFEPMANARLDQIDEELIANYIQHRRKLVSPGSVNREMATLRLALRLAHEWKITNRVPRIRKLPGERVREFVLSPAQERLYLEKASQPLQDVALLMLDTGLRVGEALALEWGDIHLEPVGGARYGYLHVKEGKSKNARRNVPLTGRVRAMLKSRSDDKRSSWLFPGKRPGPFQVNSLTHQHEKLRRDKDMVEMIPLEKEFVLHSLRHTMLTRLGESGVETFTIMKIAGHSSVVVSQRYVHPSPESMERAIAQLEAWNSGEAVKVLPLGENRHAPATLSATSSDESNVSPLGP